MTTAQWDEVIGGALSAGDFDQAESLELLERQTEILDLLVSGSPLGDVLAAVTMALERLMPGGRCSVLLLDAVGGTLHHGAAPSLPAAYCAAIDGMTIGPSAGSCGSSAFLGVPVIVTDIATDDRWVGFRDVALPFGIRACWSTPIVGAQGAVLGTFAVYHDEPHVPTRREARLIERLTHLAAVALDHARLLDERGARHEAEVARTAAEAASRAKSDFLSALSHEVRTPLSAVVGFAELLETLDLTPDRRQAALRQIGEAANHIVALLDDILDIAKVEAGAVRLELEPIAIGPIVRDVVGLLEPLATERQVTLSAAPIETADIVMADRRRVRQVLLNVVTNAIKYNRPGGGVDIHVLPKGEHQIIRVVDTGPGIPRSLQRRLFVPFDRLGAETSTTSGCGLGLPLARSVVEAMGGTLIVRSRVGEGTTVSVVLEATCRPLPRPETIASASARPLAAVRPDLSGVVLYVEDDPANVDLLSDLLRLRPGIELLSCTHALAALDVVRDRRPDVVLVDLDLPDLTGEELLALLAADGTLGRIPAAIISGRHPAYTPVDLPVFRKPLDVWALLAYLDGVLELRESRPPRPGEPGP